MIKSIKMQFILSVLTAILFVILSLTFIEFTGKNAYQFTRWVIYFAMIISVYNAGLLTQKLIQKNKREKIF